MTVTRATILFFLFLTLRVMSASAHHYDLSTGKPLLENVNKGDSAYRAFNYDEAIRHYEAALMQQQRIEVLIKLADSYFFGGYEKPKSEQEKMYWRSRDALEKARSLDSSRADIYARLGQVTGQIALFRGNEEKLKLGIKIKEYADKALELDPKCAMAHAVLGIWHYELAGLSFFERAFVNVFFGGVPKGSYDTATKHLYNAVSLAPDVIYYRNMYAKALIKVGKDKEAKMVLEEAISLPLIVAGDRRNKQESKELLMEL